MAKLVLYSWTIALPFSLCWETFSKFFCQTISLLRSIGFHWPIEVPKDDFIQSRRSIVFWSLTLSGKEFSLVVKTDWLLAWGIRERRFIMERVSLLKGVSHYLELLSKIWIVKNAVNSISRGRLTVKVHFAIKNILNQDIINQH